MLEHADWQKRRLASAVSPSLRGEDSRVEEGMGFPPNHLAHLWPTSLRKEDGVWGVTRCIAGGT